MRLFTLLALLIVALVVISCDLDQKPQVPPSTPPSIPVSPPPAASNTTDASKDAKATAEDAASEIKAATSKAAEEGNAVAETAKETATAAAGDVAKLAEQAADPAFTLDKLKAAIASLNADSLKAIADKLMSALGDKEGLVKSLQEQISKLGIADVAKLGELKKQFDSATSIASGLKGKLQVVVDKLKDQKIDVSKYTALLGGK